MSPRKVRLVVDLIRGKKIEDALTTLQFCKKHAALPVKKLLESAIANAVHNHMALRESLIVEAAFVNEGSSLKRWAPKAMGRATRILKRNSHITIIVGGEATANTNEMPDSAAEAETATA
jgi:large subunit ribosomal protein L22